MLPQPAVSKRLSDTLAKRLVQPSRVSNLGVLLLAGVCAISLLYNTINWSSRGSTYLSKYSPPFNVHPQLTRNNDLSQMSHLVVVAGHAIWKGCNAGEWRNENDWVLTDYQKATGSVEAFHDHIVKGSQILKGDRSAVLILSGGITRMSYAVQSEAQSYLKLAIESGLLEGTQRAFTEDYALDSFQNLLFSITRFHEIALAAGLSGRRSWPSKITVVGFEMKRRRFVELHRSALRWPEANFNYIGVDSSEPEGRQKGWEGENKFGYTPYSEDLYGCHGQLLEKRKSRNPFLRVPPYYGTNTELLELLHYCPKGRHVFPGSLPWDSS